MIARVGVSCTNFVKEYLEAYTDDYSKKKSTGYPEGIAAEQWGGLQNLEKAVNDADVTRVEDPETGRSFYFWKTLSTVNVQGKREGIGIGGDKKMMRAAWRRCEVRSGATSSSVRSSRQPMTRS